MVNFQISTEHRLPNPLLRSPGREQVRLGQDPAPELQADLHVLQLDRACQGAGAVHGENVVVNNKQI